VVVKLTRRGEIQIWKIVGLIVCIGVSLLGLNSSSINNGVFLGDDLQVWEGHKAGTFASDFQESIRNTALDKWRPLNTTLMIPLLSVFGDSYRNYFWFSTLLLALLLTVMWVTTQVFAPSSKRSAVLISLLGVLVVGGSHFTFFARSGVFGLLEIGPVIFCLWSFLLYQRGCESDSRRLIVYSSLTALAAGLIHERFFMFSLAIAVMIAWRSRKIKRFQGLWLLPIGNIAFYVYSATVVLNANALKGGGELNFNEVVGVWVIPRYLYALIHLLGGAGGESVFFDPLKPSQFTAGMTLSDNYSLMLPITVCLFGLLGATPFFRRQAWSRVMVGEARPGRNQGIEALFVSACLLAPAATVAGRIETRWLLGSLVFLVIAIASAPLPESSLSKIGRCGILILLLLGNLTFRDSYQEFDFWRIRAENVIDAIRNNEPQSGAWNLAIVWQDESDINSVTAWALGGGSVLRSLDNGPHEIIFGTRNQVEICPSRCLVVEVTDVGNTKRDYRKAEFQTITTFWKQ